MLSNSLGLQFAGQNPCIVLYDASGTNVIAATSYWLCEYSPMGTGNVLLTWFSAALDVPARLKTSCIFTDNPDLAAYLTKGLNRYFVGFEDKGFEEAAPMEAAIEMRLDTTGESTLRCRGIVDIILSWSNVGAPFPAEGEPSNFGPDRQWAFRSRSVILPAGRSSLIVDGRPVEGRVVEGYGTLPSSSFLALAETWTRIA